MATMNRRQPRQPDEKFIVLRRAPVIERRLGLDIPDEAKNLEEDLWARHLVEDAVVIRLQDRFAVTVLWTYAHAVIAAAEIMKECDGISEEQFSRLLEIADYFSNKAVEASEMERKLPD